MSTIETQNIEVYDFISVMAQSDEPLNEPLNTTRIAKELGMGYSTVKRVMKFLEENNLIHRVGSKKTEYWEIVPIVNDSQSDSQKSLNDRQKMIVMLMCKDRRISVNSIAVRLSLSRPTVYREIKKINAITELYWEGSAKTGHWEGKVFDSQNDSQSDSQK